jgi:hypothetical protein
MRLEDGSDGFAGMMQSNGFVDRADFIGMMSVIIDVNASFTSDLVGKASFYPSKSLDVFDAILAVCFGQIGEAEGGEGIF